MYGETKGRNGDTPAINGKLFALPVDFTVADKNTEKYTIPITTIGFMPHIISMTTGI